MTQDPLDPAAPSVPPGGAPSADAAVEAARMAFEQSPSFIAVMRGPDHVFELVNPAYERLVGGRQVVGRKAREVLPELALQGLGELLDEVYRTGITFQAHERLLEFRVPGCPASQHYVNFVYQAARGADGEITGIMSYGMDVTETVVARRRAEAAARERDAVLANIRDAVFVSDLKGNITYANPAADELHGGQAWRTMDDDEYFAQYQLGGEGARPLERGDLPLARALRGDPLKGDMTVQLRRPDGVVRWVEAHGRVMHDAAGSPVGGLVTLRDVTERREAALKSERSDRRYRELFERAPLGVAHMSPALHWMDVNGCMAAMLGYPREELVGHSVYDFGFEEDAGGIVESVQRQMKDGSGTFQVEKRYRRKDGSVLHGLLTSAVVTDEHGRLDHYIDIVQDVGEQRAAQAALRESEERFRALVEHAAVGVVSTGPDGRLRHANHAFHALLGYPDGELVGRTFAELSHPGELSANVDLFRRMKAGELDQYTIDKRYVRRDGQSVWARLFVGAVRDAARAFLYTTTLTVDLTEQRAADAALRESEERQRRIVETMSEGLVIVSRDQRIVFANAAALAMLGGRLSAPTADLRNWDVTLPDGTPLPREARPVQQVLATGQAISNIEVGIATPDGTRAILSLNAVPLRSESGEMEGVVTSVRDVTATHRAAERIRFQATLLEAVGESVIAVDTQGRVVYWNPSAERLYGYTEQEARGEPLMDLVGGGDPAGPEIMDRLMAGEPWAGEYDVQRRDGTRFPARVTTSAIRDGAGAMVGVVGISTDLTERRELEAQLHQSQKMEAVGRLAGGIAHDFNNLLSVILGTVALLLLDLDDEDPVRADLREIEAAARRAARLTQQLLAFSRKQVLKPVTLDLNERVRDMEGMLRRVIGEDVEFVTELGPGLGQVRVDPSQLEQVMMNLVVNARDAMPQGGRMLMKTTREQVDGSLRRGETEPVEPGAYVCLRVRDTGTGMDAATLARIFEPFFTTKGVGKGTGLGLSTVYGIVRQSGGFVEVDSAPGAGTEFRIYLPRVSLPEGAEDGPPVPGLPSGRGTVMLVEDEDAVRSVARRILSRAGFTVLEAASGAEALRMGEQHGFPIDVIVTDVVMPGISGAELADAFRHLHPETRVLLMSGYTDDRLVVHGVEGHPAGFVQKPFRPGELVERVRDLIDG